MALDGIPDEAITRAAQNFICGCVEKQSKRFAPSIAEFRTEAKRIEEISSYRSRYESPVALPVSAPAKSVDPMERARLRLKMPMYNHAIATGQQPQLYQANAEGFRAMVTLATKWGIPVPQELLDRDDTEMEDQWRRARNLALRDIERDPPPFMRENNPTFTKPQIGRAA